MVTNTFAFRTTTAPSTILRTTTVATGRGRSISRLRRSPRLHRDVDHVRVATDAHDTTTIETMAWGSPRRTGPTDYKERGQGLWRSWFRCSLCSRGQRRRPRQSNSRTTGAVPTAGSGSPNGSAGDHRERFVGFPAWRNAARAKTTKQKKDVAKTKVRNHQSVKQYPME